MGRSFQGAGQWRPQVRVRVRVPVRVCAVRPGPVHRVGCRSSAVATGPAPLSPLTGEQRPSAPWPAGSAAVRESSPAGLELIQHPRLAMPAPLTKVLTHRGPCCPSTLYPPWTDPSAPAPCAPGCSLRPFLLSAFALVLWPGPCGHSTLLSTEHGQCEAQDGPADMWPRAVRHGGKREQQDSQAPAAGVGPRSLDGVEKWEWDPCHARTAGSSSQP